MNSNNINTPVTIPNELNFELPGSMPPSRKFELRVPPYNKSTFSTPGEQIKINLPAMDRTLYNLQTAYLFGEVEFTIGGAAGVDFAYILGSFYNMFDRQVIRGGSGYVLETLDYPGRLANCITSFTMNKAEKMGLQLASGYTIKEDKPAGNIGAVINTTSLPSDGKNHTFAIPLIGILNMLKMYPAWNKSDVEIELTLAQLSNYIVNATANGVTAVNIKSVEFVCECLELAPESYNMIMANNPGQIVLKSQSYLFGSSGIPAAYNSGSIDIPFQIKVHSMKQLIWYTSPSDAVDAGVGGVNPNLSDWNFIVNGMSYPQRSIQCRFPSEAFMQIRKSFGSVYSSSHSGHVGINNFTASTAYNAYYKAYPKNTTAAAKNLLANGTANKFYNFLDIESMNNNKESLYSGISTNGTTSTIRLNISSQLENVAHAFNYWTCHDVLIVLDLNMGITSKIE